MRCVESPGLSPSGSRAFREICEDIWRMVSQPELSLFPPLDASFPSTGVELENLPN